MIRVLQVVNRMGYGGIEAFLMNIYRNIDRNKIQFDFAVHSKEKGEYDEEIKKMGGQIYYFTSRRESIKKYYTDWDKFLKKKAYNYNAIHMHVSSLTTIIPIKLAQKYNIKNRIIHAHSTFQKGMIHKFLNSFNQKVVCKYANNLLACSTEAGNYVFGKEKFKNFYNGIDVEKYKFNKTIRDKIRKSLNLREDEIALVHVGRFTYAKNHTFLIDIFNEINKKESNYKLFLIGNGELKNEIVQKVNNLKLEKKIIFLDNRSDVYDILQGMDLFIFPSNFEGLPLVMIEAQAAGLPIVASNHISKESKISDLVEFVTLSNNPKEWAQIITSPKASIRNDMSEIITKKGYNIMSLVNYISKIYCN